MEAFLWLAVPVGYALGMLLAEVAWRLVADDHPLPAVPPDLPQHADRQPLVLDAANGREVRAWG